MPKYEMKYMFDWGGGTCLWSINDTAIEQYDYAVNVDSLPLSEKLKKDIFILLDEHDAALNWDDPAGDLLWSPEQESLYITRAKAIYPRICSELGHEYSIEFDEKYLI